MLAERLSVDSCADLNENGAIYAYAEQNVCLKIYMSRPHLANVAEPYGNNGWMLV